MAISKEHTEFIRLVSDGVSQKEAYRVSVGKKGVSDTTCEVKSSILAKKYAKEIESERIRQQNVVTSVKDNKVVKNALNKILSVAEVDAIMCESINNPESPQEKLKAVEIYYKRFGANAPTDLNIEGNLNLSKRAVIKFSNGKRDNNTD
jgi:hypothetical protein